MKKRIMAFIGSIINILTALEMLFHSRLTLMVLGVWWFLFWMSVIAENQRGTFLWQSWEHFQRHQWTLSQVVVEIWCVGYFCIMCLGCLGFFLSYQWDKDR